MSLLRVFVADSTEPESTWTELTDAGSPAVRVRARDLQQAQKSRQRLRAQSTAAVILDLRVLIAEDRYSARRLLAASATIPEYRDSVHYIGTIDGLAGLLTDIHTAEVADGVTLIAAVPGQDVRAVAERALRTIKSWRRPAA